MTKRVFLAALALIGATVPAAIAFADPITATIASAALSGGLAYASGTVIFGLTSVGLSAALIGGASLVLGFVTQALAPKPKTPDMPTAFAAIASDRTIMVRQPITSGKIQFGRIRLSGPQTFVERTAEGGGTMHVLLTLSISPMSRFDELWLDDEQVPLDWAFGAGVGGNATGKYAGKIKAWFGAGTEAGDATLHAALTAAVGSKWTPDHKQTGCGKLYVQMIWDRDLFESGTPNLSGIFRCSPEIFDPRTDTTGWTNNAALVLARYMTMPVNQGGFGADVAEIDDADWIAAANACDEMADLAEKSVDFTADAGANTIDLASGKLSLTTGAKVRLATTGTLPTGLATGTDYYFINLGENVGQLATTLENAEAGTEIDFSTAGTGTHSIRIETAFTANATDNLIELDDGAQRLRTGSRVTVSTTGTLPGGLSAATNYFFVETGTNKGGLATSLANARARTLIDITSAGTGTHSITANAEPRYTADGTIDTNDTPEQVIPKLLSAMAGKLIRRGGKWHILAGVWTGPTIAALDEDDVIAGFQVAWRREPRDVFNGVKGTYTDPDSNWQPGDFPTVSVAAYLEEDQDNRVWKDADLPFTISPSMAQRIARIDLERNRRQIQFAPQCKIKALKVVPGEVIPFDWDRYGWTGGTKTFEVAKFRLVIGNSDGVPSVSVELGLSEIDANVYAWTPADDEVVLAPSARSNIASASSVAAPSDIELASGTDELDVRVDGTIFSRLRVSWTAPADGFVTSGGQIEIQYRKTADPDWSPSEFTDGAATSYRILDVEDGVEYEARIRARNYLGIRSAWLVSDPHVVIGKTAAPSDVEDFSAATNGAAVVLKWSPVSDADLDGYDIRFSSTAVSSWAAATPISQAEGGTSITSLAVPPGEWNFYIKARDTSGNLSEEAAMTSASISVFADGSTRAVVYSAEQAPDWLGTKTNCHVHHTGKLIPDSTELAADMTDADLWDEFNAYPVAEATYEAPAADLGQDAEVRTYAITSGALGFGETAGAPIQFLEQDYKLAAGAYDGFEPWTIGTNTLRQFKQKITLRAVDGIQLATAFAPTADAAARTEQGANVATLSGGTAITFDRPFFDEPSVQATAVGGGGAQQAWAEDVTTTGFTLFTATGTGTPNDAHANWSATGV